jgi:hypothetical protein
VEFSAEEKVSIEHLVKGGFPEQMARVAIAAKKAGYKEAESETAAFVKVLSKGEGKSKVQTEEIKQRLQAGLAEVAGKGDFQSIQKSIALKRQLSNLDR